MKSSAARLQQLRAELIAKKIHIETRRIYSENMIPSLKMEIRQNVTKEFEHLTKGFKTSLSAGQETIADWQWIASDLRNSVIASVRSISHDLWNQTPQKAVPDLTAFEIIRMLFFTIIRRNDLSTQLEVDIETKKIEQLSSEILSLRFSKDIAKYLHGNLQSRLTAILFAMEIAGKKHDQVEFKIQLKAAQQAIATPFDHFFETEPESLAAEIAKLTHAWDPLITIRLINLGNDDHVSALDSEAILLCIEEGLSNAFHHGQATEVSIRISTSTQVRAISIIDNGIGPMAGVPSLGSSLFNASAGANWSLERGPHGVGSQLELQIKK